MEPKTSFKNVIEFTNWLKTQPGEKTIRIRAIFKITVATVMPAKDRNGRYLGGVVEKPTREQIEQNIYVPTYMSQRKLQEATEFDLNNPVDAADWEWVQYSPSIALTRQAAMNNERAKFYIELPEYEASLKLSSMQIKLKAMNLIASMVADTKEQIRHVASMLAKYDMAAYSDNEVTSWLYSYADKSTDAAREVITLIEDPDFAITMFMLDLFKHKVIVRDSSGIYRYGNEGLGMKEEHVKEVLRSKKKAHVELVELMKRDLKTFQAIS